MGIRNRCLTYAVSCYEVQVRTYEQLSLVHGQQ